MAIGLLLGSAAPALATHDHPASTLNAVIPLVRAFTQCTVPNITHVPPLALPACNPPVPLSPFTIDPAGDFGWVKFAAVAGPDLRIRVNIRHVNVTFTGNLLLRFLVRQTDDSCVGGCTLADYLVSVTVPCTTGVCITTQFLNVILPGTITGANPARNFEFSQMEVYDPTGTLFMKQGSFAP